MAAGANPAPVTTFAPAPSCASQTAWAVLGLRAAGETNAPAAKRGLDYLLSRQNPDGSWPEEATTGTGFPNIFYLTYGMYRDYFPMLALAGWLEALRPVPIFPVERPSRLPCRHSAGIREREFV